jgi:hypothetical protein
LLSHDYDAMPCSQGPKPEPASIEMSGPSVSLLFTQGTISIWFGKKTEKSIIAKILIIISKVDSSTEHEREVICNFEEISEFESNGYVLTTYARRDDKYRAIFVVPFSNPRALDRFIESVCEETDHGDVKITLYWSGGRVMMNIAKEELNKLNCFSVLNITYKEDQSK